MLCPPPLALGSRVRIVAPSSPFDVTLVRRGMGWLAERYRVEFDQRMFERDGFLAGTDTRRRDELQQALGAPELGAVIAARGGYGLTRILAELDFSAVLRAPKWLVGFSDFTAVHHEAVRAGVISLHAHNAAGLGRGCAHTRKQWLDAVESPLSARCFDGLETWVPGTAEGPLFGGNLTVLHTLAASHKLRPPAGCVLLLEDVSETSYRVDRMLTALLDSSALDGVSGIVLGEFFACSAGKYGVPVERVLRERLGLLGVPVAAGLPCGHGRHNAPLPMGAPARMHAETLARLEITPATRRH